MKKNEKKKMGKKKKRWKDGEELLANVSYYDSLKNNFHVLEVYLSVCQAFWISEVSKGPKLTKEKKLECFMLFKSILFWNEFSKQ